MYHVRSVIDRLRPLKQKDPTQHGKPVSHFKIKTLKTKDTPSPTEAKRLTRWDEALPRHFRKDDPTCLGHTKLPSTLWFRKSGDHLWTLRAWEKLQLSQEPAMLRQVIMKRQAGIRGQLWGLPPVFFSLQSSCHFTPHTQRTHALPKSPFRFGKKSGEPITLFKTRGFVFQFFV